MLFNRHFPILLYKLFHKTGINMNWILIYVKIEMNLLQYYISTKPNQHVYIRNQS